MRGKGILMGRGNMEEKIKCPKCGSSNLEPSNESTIGSPNNPTLPDAEGPLTYECKDCGYQFIEDDLKEN